MASIVIYLARQFVLLLTLRAVILLLSERPPLRRGFPNSYTKEFLMEANKTELLLAWMTLVKLRDSNVLDAGDDQIVLSTLQILDAEQRQMED